MANGERPLAGAASRSPNVCDLHERRPEPRPRPRLPSVAAGLQAGHCHRGGHRRVARDSDSDPASPPESRVRVTVERDLRLRAAARLNSEPQWGWSPSR